MLELDNELFKMTEEEIRACISEYNNYALVHVIKCSGCNEIFLRELRDFFGDEFIYHNFSVSENFRRELKLK